MIQEARTYSQQRQHEIEAEQVSLHEQTTSVGHARAPYTTNPDLAVDLGLVSQQVQGNSPVDRPRKVQKVVENHGDGDDDGLQDLRTVDPSQNVDAVRGKRGEEGHVDVIQRT